LPGPPWERTDSLGICILTDLFLKSKNCPAANQVLAIGNARMYLEEDSLDIRTFPEFVHIMKNGAELNAVRFNITAERI
jgi:stage V sporulation protein SpoVS